MKKIGKTLEKFFILRYNKQELIEEVVGDVRFTENTKRN